MEHSPANAAANLRLPGSVLAIRAVLWVQVALIVLAWAIVSVAVFLLGTLGIADTASTRGLLWILVPMLLGTVVVLGVPVAVAIIGLKRRPWARHVIVAWEALMILVSVGLGALALAAAGPAASGWSIATTNLGTQPPRLDFMSFFWPLVWLALSGTALFLAVRPTAGVYYSGEAAATPAG